MIDKLTLHERFWMGDGPFLFVIPPSQTKFYDLPHEKGRDKFTALISADEKNYYDLIILEDQPKGEFSYPAIIQLEDGADHITYRYKRTLIKYVE